MTDIVKRLGLFDGSDIVERLRSGEDGLEYAAADEIERLSMDRDVWRNESIKKQAACEQMGARITALEAERDRLASSCGHCGELERAFAHLHESEAKRAGMKEAMLGLARMIERYHNVETDEEFREIDAALTAARIALKETGHD
jgi:hypothetical protein